MNESLASCIVDAAYNYHLHTNSSCFGKSEHSVGKQKRDKFYECRYRFPQRKKKRTHVQNVSETPVRWFFWDGSFDDRYIKEVCERRRSYDAFQNVACHAISHSKLTCNTNVLALMPGPAGQYAFKYHLKGTQKDDTEQY
jgi:hypothetical protein